MHHIKCITNIDGTTIDYAKNLHSIMYNLVKYSWNFYETTGSLWFYSKDQTTNFNADIANNNNFKYFDYKAKLSGNTEGDGVNGILKNVTVTVPLHYSVNFWRSLEMTLINCKIELKLKRTKYCVLSAAGADNNDGNSNNFVFSIKDTIICSCSNFISKRLSKTIKTF